MWFVSICRFEFIRTQMLIITTEATNIPRSNEFEPTFIGGYIWISVKFELGGGITGHFPVPRPAGSLRS